MPWRPCRTSSRSSTTRVRPPFLLSENKLYATKSRAPNPLIAPPSLPPFLPPCPGLDGKAFREIAKEQNAGKLEQLPEMMHFIEKEPSLAKVFKDCKLREGGKEGRERM